MKAVIVGGKGRMAKPFTQILSSMEYKVEILDKEDWKHAKAILSAAHLVLISVPIMYFRTIVEKTCQYISPTALLIDISSIKETPLKTMLYYHQGAVLALHPMFGPNLTFQNNKLSTALPLTIVNCGGRYEEKSQYVVDALTEMRFLIKNMPAETHDFYTSFIQGLHYFNVFIEGFYFYEKQQKESQLNFSLFEHDKCVTNLDFLLTNPFSQHAFDELRVMFLDISKAGMYFGILFYELKRVKLYKEFLEIADQFLNEQESPTVALDELQKYLNNYKFVKISWKFQLLDFSQCLHFLLLFFEATLLLKNDVNLDELRAISTINYNNKLGCIFNIFGNDKGKTLLQSLFDRKYISEYKKVIKLMRQFIENNLTQELFIATYLQIAPLIKNMSKFCSTKQEIKTEKSLISKL